MGAVDLQAFLALFVIFGSILLHLIFKPFDTSIKEMRLLHHLEFAALTFCWFTFWGGLLFYLGHETPDSIPDFVLETMSIVIIVANVGFLLFAMLQFFKEFVRDLAHQKDMIKKKHSSLVAVLPVVSDDVEATTDVRTWKNGGDGGGDNGGDDNGGSDNGGDDDGDDDNGGWL